MNRKLHRWLGFAAAIFFLFVASTGVVLQFQQLFGAEEANKEALAQVMSRVSLDQALQPASGLDHARSALLQRFGNRPVDSVDWQIKGADPFFTFHLGGTEPLRVEVNAANGRIISVESDEEDFFVRLHSGEILGDGGKVLGLAWGLGLVFMVVTGFVIYLQIYRARQRKERTRGKGIGRWFWSIAGALFLFGGRATSAEAASPGGLSFNPDAGIVFASGDFKLTAWGFAERAFDPDGPDYFRRFRQGAELDLPRISEGLRPAIVYEVDLTNTDFFGEFGPGGQLGRRNFENLFLALQHPDDPSKFRLLIGENTHILSREDNLSSGNLPTVNRSLILEEHGSVNSFGSQFGVELQKAVSDRLTIQLAALDNRGSLNSANPRYQIGNSLSGKLVFTSISRDGRKLTLGAAIDHTRNIRDRTFTLATAIGAAPIGGVEATGNKLTGQADIAYSFPLIGHPVTIEAEAIYSSFSGSKSDVGGGYVQGQFSLFDAPSMGDLDIFVRCDLVSLGMDSVNGRATQQAVRAGLNYNLPHTDKLANLHFEYAHNRLAGPDGIVSDRHPADEFRIVLRTSLQRYSRH